MAVTVVPLVASRADRVLRDSSDQTSRRDFLFPDRWKHTSESGLNRVLSASLLAADKDLRQVVDEVDEISKALKSGAPNDQTARVVLHPAVWCAIKQALIERELEYLGLSDNLTCLYNRRGFFAAATQQLKLACRNELNSLLLFCDLGNLRMINDCYGHREGDLALIRAADALEQTFRCCDILARVGGDRFAVLSLGTASQNQQAILDRLEGILEKSNADGPGYDLSFSIGVARFDPKHTVSLGELMAQADHDICEQKRTKRESGRF